ncbi:hypothetical protein [uncultured Imperialibacter sp.]|uniref:hypothetical protein n=1 Tax=uncultured Imperialibacter sp. TaxID=1672639 RepID=UPI0030D7D523|tara:strand:+ start:803 stop:1027 length:225 start_codon:yes stop_codon:yes gene_type:complete
MRLRLAHAWWEALVLIPIVAQLDECGSNLFTWISTPNQTNYHRPIAIGFQNFNLPLLSFIRFLPFDSWYFAAWL